MTRPVSEGSDAGLPLPSIPKKIEVGKTAARTFKRATSSDALRTDAVVHKKIQPPLPAKPGAKATLKVEGQPRKFEKVTKEKEQPGVIQDVLLKKMPSLEKGVPQPLPALPKKAAPPLPPTPLQRSASMSKLPPLPALPRKAPPLLRSATGLTPLKPAPQPPSLRSLSDGELTVGRKRADAAASVQPITIEKGRALLSEIAAKYHTVMSADLKDLHVDDMRSKLIFMDPEKYTFEKCAQMTPQETYYAIVKEAVLCKATMTNNLESLKGLGDAWTSESKQRLLDQLAEVQFALTELLKRFPAWNIEASKDVQKSINAGFDKNFIQMVTNSIVGAGNATTESIKLVQIDQDCFEIDTVLQELQSVKGQSQDVESDPSAKLKRDTDAYSYQELRNKLETMEKMLAPRRGQSNLTVTERVAMMRVDARKALLVKTPLESCIGMSDRNRALLRDLDKNEASSWVPRRAKLLATLGRPAQLQASYVRIARVLAKQMVQELYSRSEPIPKRNSLVAQLWEKLSKNQELRAIVESELYQGSPTLLDTFKAKILNQP